MIDYIRAFLRPLIPWLIPVLFATGVGAGYYLHAATHVAAQTATR